MNALMGEKLSIITPKAQTTRHRIQGIWNNPDFQIVFSDTPGILDPGYKLHEFMMRFVSVSLEDADLILYIIEAGEKEVPESVLKRLQHRKDRTVLIINKIDLKTEEEIAAIEAHWKTYLDPMAIFKVSALKQTGIVPLFGFILDHIPEHPAYFDKEYLSDKPERFFATEIIREKIFLNYDKEIPYCSEVVIESFKEEETIIRIRVVIFVERESQKPILIGKGGAALKKVGIQARKDLEAFLGKHVHLETTVKVDPDWRNKDSSLQRYGYLQKD